MLFVQNLIHRGKHRLSVEQAEWRNGERELPDRPHHQRAPPFPAVTGLQYVDETTEAGRRWLITGGASLWAGFSLGDCQREMNRIGPEAFLLESQHEVEADNPNALLTG